METVFTTCKPKLIKLVELKPGDWFILDRDRYSALPSPRILCLLTDTTRAASYKQVACFSAGESKTISIFADAPVIKLDATLLIDTHGVYIKGMGDNQYGD